MDNFSSYPLILNLFLAAIVLEIMKAIQSDRYSLSLNIRQFVLW